jgi:hypothetical protein
VRRRSRGHAKSITDIAEHEGMKVAYICRLLPLNCLEPIGFVPPAEAEAAFYDELPGTSMAA